MPEASHQPPEPSAVSKLIETSGAKSAGETLTLEILHNLRYQHEWSDLRLHVVHLNSASGSGEDDMKPTMINLESDHYFSPNYQLQQQQGRSPSPSRSATSSQSTTALTTPSSTTTSPQSIEPPNNTTIRLISGLPPRHSYMHPDLQLYLVKHSILEASLPVQREFVLPLSTAEKWTLRRFCAVFDALDSREKVVVGADAAASSVAVGGTATDGGGCSGGTRANGSANRPTSAPASRARAPYEHKDQKRVLLGMRAREGGGGDGTVVYYIMQEGEVKPRQNG